MARDQVVVLGVNGRIGSAVAEAFVAAGWEVTGMARQAGRRLAGVRYVTGSSDSVADMQEAIGEARVVVNALNMRYDRWFGGAMEAQMARVVEAMGTTGKTMLFPGNIYNYSGSLRVVTPDAPQEPQTPRGAIRVRVEEAFRRAAEAGHIQVAVIRAGDFYGPGAKGDWFDEIVFRGRKPGRASIPGTPGVGHSWAYLPDLARAFVKVAEKRVELAPFELFHFAGNYVTPEELGATMVKVAPAPLRLSRFNPAILIVGGLLSPLIRAVAKMRYLWARPMELSDSRFDALLGPGFATPFEVAIEASIRPFFTTARADVGQSAAVGKAV